MAEKHESTQSLSGDGPGVVEEALDRFEEAWQSGRGPALEDFLPAAGRLATLQELVHVDLEYRLKAGEPARAEDYLRRFPELADSRPFVLSLLTTEYRLRRRGGLVSLDEYRQRFPQHFKDLAARFAAGPPLSSPGVSQENTAPISNNFSGSVLAGPCLPETPQTVDTQARYRVGHLHARGGLGEIRVAVDEGLRREVALKLLQAEQAHHPGSRRRFLREAEITSQLEHPGVVPVYGLGEVAGGSPVYAMRFIRGQSLREAAHRFHGGPEGAGKAWERSLAFRQLLTRFVTVCNTLAYAHSRGVLHRDVKPDNIMLGEYGETLVVDWGLARCFGPGQAPESDPGAGPQAEGDGGQTQVGTVVGTPGYMSPEQAAGRQDLLGPAMDIYGLGATLYVLLTGRSPFPDRLVSEVLVKVMRGDFAPPREVKKGVPPALEAVCLKAMAREPDDRYATALELARDLESWLADEPVGAWAEPFRVRARRWVARHTALVASGAVGLLALTTLAVVTVWLEGARERDRMDKRVAELKSAEDRRRLEQVDRDSYLYRIDDADRAWWASDLKRSLASLDGCKPELRGWEWNYLRRRCVADLVTLEGHQEVVWTVAFHPDGRRLATASLDGTVRVWDTATGKQLLCLRGHRRPVWGAVFSPDGRRLASGGEDGVVRFWDATTGAPLGTLDAGGWNIMSLCFNPEGNLLAVGCAGLCPESNLLAVGGGPARALSKQDRAGVVKVFDLAAEKEVTALRQEMRAADCVTFSPHGKRLAATNGEGTITVWDVRNGRQLTSYQGHQGPAHALAFSPDGRLLASAGADQVVLVWDTKVNREKSSLQGHLNQVWGVAFSPDGKRLASSSDDGTIKVWNPALGRLLFTLRGHRAGIANVTFSPDGRRLASASDDQTARVWDVTGRPDSLTLCGHTSRVWGVAFSPDGRLVATSGDEKTVRVWEARTGQQVFQFVGPAGSARVAFRPDGRQLASAHDDGTVMVWDLRTGGVVRRLRGHENGAWAVTFSPDGKYLATASLDGTVKIWDARTGKELRTIRAHRDKVWALAFSPDGERLASAGADRLVKIWDPATGRELRTLRGHASEVLGLAFSPDGKLLASCSADAMRTITQEPGEIKIWDPATGKEKLSLRGHGGAITGVAFSPDGKRLVSSSMDGRIKIWEAATGREILTLYGHRGAVCQVVFDRDGRRLASASWDGVAIIWNGSPYPKGSGKGER